MIAKYQHILDKVHQYIYNRIQVEDDNLLIARELFEKYPVYVAFFKCDTEMIISMLEQLTIGIRLTRTVLETNFKHNINLLQEKLDGFQQNNDKVE